MGGFGSGHRFPWRGKKGVVEDYRSLDIASFRREKVLGWGVCRSGVWSWYRGGESKPCASIGYTLDTTCREAPYLRVYYTSHPIGGPAGEGRDYLIPLAVSRPNYGGWRWWFLCPLLRRGVACDQRVRKLYLRQGWFGCRQCHDLTYTSCQEHDSRVDWLCRHPELIEQMLAQGSSVPRLGLLLKASTKLLKRLQ